jgi:hypothetical protein
MEPLKEGNMLVDSSVVVQRLALYQGSIPVVEYGYKCLVCRTTVWPHWTGDNSPLPRCYHVRPNRCPVLDIPVRQKLDITDF